ncbi:Ribokinase [Microbacterium hydrocarbonoxydans]|uniref:Ribokinase n=1 Tax=Microbacterium hydrocarbonoxydans TaxID=273678 RepID=A0A0M2HXL6_9MICO|nr:ribokinase [Microbacterium hydrocarbonoxydans]KJL49174.1 Ribokinase [Microbacterium hydrocarbonoxydans]
MIPPETDAIRVTVVGAINVDLTARVSRAPSRGETVGDGVLAREAGGKGANQAVAAARLGAVVSLVGAVGDDPDGREMRSSLSRAGVDTANVQTSVEPTGTALIVVDSEGENSIVVCPGANSMIDPDSVRLPDQEALLMQLEVQDDVVVAAAVQASGFVAVNASPARSIPEPVLSRADLFIVNETEYAQLPEIRNAPLLAVTLGAEGAVLYEHGIEISRADGLATVVRNTVGAGDAFAAALVIGLARSDDRAVALQRACPVGAAAVADEHSQADLGPLDDYPAMGRG